MKESLNALFVKYLEDNCSEAEIKNLLEHFKIPQNEELLKHFILTELEQQDELDFPLVDVEERLHAIYNRVQIHARGAGAQHKGFFKMRWYRVAAAAAIFILFGAGLFLFNQKQNSDGLRLAMVKNNIKPGYNQAVLTLANGSKINLSNLVAGQVAKQLGASITKTANGQIIYQATANVPENGERVGYNTIEAPAGGQWQVILPDKSHVWLNALSSITYPTAFIGNERRVQLKGEAYFEVAHNAAMPFKVSSRNQTVEVLGTHFDIMAYDNEPLIKTTLLEGSVKVSNSGKVQMLKPGQQAQVGGSDIKMTSDVDLEDVVAWKNGYFKFNENLEAIMSKIARWYDVSVVYQSKPNPDYTFAGEISRERDLSEILKIMEYTGKVHFSIEGRRIIVNK
ncbi:FecR family protein [Mucilaginibacter paludis]|uniref:Anti-FecI sigma factor, FecR n=1 Tax=Mucilaginibacter paludis DSM 18603 TaxID=714943 RepID=H1Y5D9_9SPHI|nr:FecR family protein [Mucilaginibacter paludis]EHQ28950.1 anti-FecI sigma factor, FecR [Mucilaginibacter paludis DSM 18603]